MAGFVNSPDFGKCDKVNHEEHGTINNCSSQFQNVLLYIGLYICSWSVKAFLIPSPLDSSRYLPQPSENVSNLYESWNVSYLGVNSLIPIVIFFLSLYFFLRLHLWLSLSDSLSLSFSLSLFLSLPLSLPLSLSLSQWWVWLAMGSHFFFASPFLFSIKEPFLPFFIDWEKEFAIVHQSISQSVNQSISQSVNQSISQSVNQSISKSVNPEVALR